MSLVITVENRNAFEEDTTIRATINRGPNGGVFFDGSTRSAAVEGALQLLNKLEGAEAREPGVRADEAKPLGLSRHVAVTTVEIRALLEQAADNGDVVEIDYTNDGGVPSTRDIKVKGFDRFVGRGGAHIVQAYDHQSGEYRHFRLDRISRAEVR